MSSKSRSFEFGELINVREGKSEYTATVVEVGKRGLQVRWTVRGDFSTVEVKDVLPKEQEGRRTRGGNAEEAAGGGEKKRVKEAVKPSSGSKRSRAQDEDGGGGDADKVPAAKKKVKAAAAAVSAPKSPEKKVNKKEEEEKKELQIEELRKQLKESEAQNVALQKQLAAAQSPPQDRGQPKVKKGGASSPVKRRESSRR
jgi:hypothetical protein